MAMSRAGYIKLAEAYAAKLKITEGDVRKGVAIAIRTTADVFKMDPRFRYDTFFEVCGLDAFGELKGN